jgi:hypothetical protein
MQLQIDTTSITALRESLGAPRNLQPMQDDPHGEERSMEERSLRIFSADVFTQCVVPVAKGGSRWDDG